MGESTDRLYFPVMKNADLCCQQLYPWPIHPWCRPWRRACPRRPPHPCYCLSATPPSHPQPCSRPHPRASRPSVDPSLHSPCHLRRFHPWACCPHSGLCLSPRRHHPRRCRLCRSWQAHPCCPARCRPLDHWSRHSPYRLPCPPRRPRPRCPPHRRRLPVHERVGMRLCVMACECGREYM